MVEHKIRMCDVLSDIEVAQDMVEASQQEDRLELQPHPADDKYATLMADLKVIPAKEEEYKVIQQYCQVRPLILTIMLIMLMAGLEPISYSIQRCKIVQKHGGVRLNSLSECDLYSWPHNTGSSYSAVR